MSSRTEMISEDTFMDIHWGNNESHRWGFVLLVAMVLLSSSLSGQTYFYDDAGRLIQVAYPQGNGISCSYAAADNLMEVSRITLPASPSGQSAQRVSENCVELTWQDVSTTETGYLIMRRTIDNYDWEEVGAVGANQTSFTDCSLDPLTSYVYRIAAEGSQGLSAYGGELTPVDPTAARLAVDVGGAATASTADNPGDSQVGYASLDVHYGGIPYGTAVFSVSQNDVVVSEAGVPASPPTTASRLFIDHRSAVSGNHFDGTLDINTGIAVVNRGGGSASVTYTLRDLNGSVLTTGNGILAQGAHFAKFINQIIDVAPNFSLPADFPTATGFGSLEVSSSQPLSILALRLTINQVGDALLTSTPVADLSQPVPSGPLYFPQFADGGGFVSAIVLLNTSTSTETGKLEIFGDTGSPLAVQQLGGPLASFINYSIAPGGAFVFQTDGSAPTPAVGWALLTPDPGNSTPVGAGVFQLGQNGVVVTESGVPSAAATTRARIYVDTSQGHDTGLAIVNPGQGQLTVTLQSFETDGVTQAGSSLGPLSLASRGHTARFVGELVSGLPEGFTGVMEISSTSPFVALTLRSLFNGRGDFLLTTFPIADLTRTAPTPIIFPQIADGGGITTQFILLSGGAASSTTVRYFAEDGVPLFLGTAP